jgi:glutamate synthase domain-containing protein 2
MDVAWGTQRIINLYNAWRKELVGILRRFGMRRVTELRGRTDLLMHLDYSNDVRVKP